MTKKPNPITCLNGQFIRADRAMVPVADRGFRFGDGVFETIRIEGGVPYQWEFHLNRLMQGLSAIRITPPEVDLKHYVNLTLHKNKAVDGYLRIAISRGVGSRGYLPFPAGMQPTWVIEYLAPVPAPEAPASLWLSTLARVPTSALPTHHKLAQGLGSTLASLEAAEHGCDDALQLTTGGILCEAASSNVFWLKGNELFTPSAETGCLGGSTRATLLRLSGIPVREVNHPLSALEGANTVFISNCRVGVWPVAELKPLGWRFDAQHPLLAQLGAALADDRASYTTQHSAEWVTA